MLFNLWYLQWFNLDQHGSKCAAQGSPVCEELGQQSGLHTCQLHFFTNAKCVKRSKVILKQCARLNGVLSFVKLFIYFNIRG